MTENQINFLNNLDWIDYNSNVCYSYVLLDRVLSVFGKFGKFETNSHIYSIEPAFDYYVKIVCY